MDGGESVIGLNASDNSDDLADSGLMKFEKPSSHVEQAVSLKVAHRN